MVRRDRGLPKALDELAVSVLTMVVVVVEVLNTACAHTV